MKWEQRNEMQCGQCDQESIGERTIVQRMHTLIHDEHITDQLQEVSVSLFFFSNKTSIVFLLII